MSADTAVGDSSDDGRRKVLVGYRGALYKLRLSSEEAAKFDQLMAPYVGAGRAAAAAGRRIRLVR